MWQCNQSDYWTTGVFSHYIFFSANVQWLCNTLVSCNYKPTEIHWNVALWLCVPFDNGNSGLCVLWHHKGLRPNLSSLLYPLKPCGCHCCTCDWNNTSILVCWRSSPWQHLHSPSSKWVIKKRWRGFTGDWYAWHPKSPSSTRSSLAKRSKLQLSSKQARPSFIYFGWNIDACYERFKIMCLPFFFVLCPSTLFSNT